MLAAPPHPWQTTNLLSAFFILHSALHRYDFIVRNPTTLLLAVLIGLMLHCVGCATRLTPPANVADPVQIQLVDYGRTSLIVIPDHTGQHLVEYAYGDWDWYALRKTEWWRAIPALLWPTRGALGRAEIAHFDEAGVERIHTITVERSAAARLQRELDSQFWNQRNTLVYTPEVNMEFVHFGHWYWGFHNSNYATACWLHKMGVRVRGTPLWSSWKITTPTQ